MRTAYGWLTLKIFLIIKLFLLAKNLESKHNHRKDISIFLVKWAFGKLSGFFHPLTALSEFRLWYIWLHDAVSFSWRCARTNSHQYFTEIVNIIWQKKKKIHRMHAAQVIACPSKQDQVVHFVDQSTSSTPMLFPTNEQIYRTGPSKELTFRQNSISLKLPFSLHEILGPCWPWRTNAPRYPVCLEARTSDIVSQLQWYQSRSRALEFSPNRFEACNTLSSLSITSTCLCWILIFWASLTSPLQSLGI